MIAPGTVLTPENAGDAIETLNDEAVKIRVPALGKQVNQAWRAMDKTRLISRKTSQPRNGIDFSTDQVPRASSGCYVTPKIVKM